tara:strand:+ start:381 stop:1499 length:1119 start_codon:yes stop_codon:yes gene_type:complete
MKIVRNRIILDLSETHREKFQDWTGLYSHLAGDKIFYRLDKPAQICYAIKDGDYYIKPQNNVVLSNTLAIQNFRVFIDTNPATPEDERYKAIGGYHTSKTHSDLKGCSVTENSKMLPAENPCWPEEERLLMEDNFQHPRHANGFYIFKSPDGIKWELYHKKPVLSAFTVCEENILGSDSMPSIFYDRNIEEYVLYLRCNIKLGVRHVFYTKSKDLINWDKPRLITKDPCFDFNHENLYFMGAYPLNEKNKYISFSHHFKNEILSSDGSHRRYYDRRTKIMLSDDGLHWKEIGNLFAEEKDTWKIENRESGCVSSFSTHLGPPHVISFKENVNHYCLYVLEGICTQETKILQYLINKNDLNKALDAVKITKQG